MSDPENKDESFLQRWSRRKQIAETRPRGAAAPAESAAGAAAGADAEGKPDLPAFDPATLPSIDSITATSDIRAFLAPGVPEELTRAALRRVWITDPTIRDFVGLAENQGDFTKPGGVPGFGPLELTAELRRTLLAWLVGRPTEQPPSGDEPDKPRAETSDKLPQYVAHHAVPNLLSPAGGGGIGKGTGPADAGEATKAPAELHRRHGGALPK